MSEEFHLKGGRMMTVHVSDIARIKRDPDMRKIEGEIRRIEGGEIFRGNPAGIISLPPSILEQARQEGRDEEIRRERYRASQLSQVAYDNGYHEAEMRCSKEARAFFWRGFAAGMLWPAIAAAIYFAI